MIKYNMFIDDERVPSDVTWGTREELEKIRNSDWEICRNMKEVVDTINEFGMPQFISFDHDLGNNEPTGYDIMKWIVNRDLIEENNFPENFDIIVHSKNPVGKKNIELYFDNYMSVVYDKN